MMHTHTMQKRVSVYTYIYSKYLRIESKEFYCTLNNRDRVIYFQALFALKRDLRLHDPTDSCILHSFFVLPVAV